jgi:hypothetical protein
MHIFAALCITRMWSHRPSLELGEFLVPYVFSHLQEEREILMPKKIKKHGFQKHTEERS